MLFVQTLQNFEAKNFAQRGSFYQEMKIFLAPRDFLLQHQIQNIEVLQGKFEVNAVFHLIVLIYKSKPIRKSRFSNKTALQQDIG